MSAVSSRPIKNPQISENYWFPTPEIPGNLDEHTSIQKRIQRELQALQDLEIIDPTKDEKSRAKFQENFDWKDSILEIIWGIRRIWAYFLGCAETGHHPN